MARGGGTGGVNSQTGDALVENDGAGALDRVGHQSEPVGVSRALQLKDGEHAAVFAAIPFLCLQGASLFAKVITST